MLRQETMGFGGSLKPSNTSISDSLRTSLSTGEGFGTPPAEAVTSPSTVGSLIKDSGHSQSLSNSVYEFPTENGRSYHGYKAGSYPYPNDYTERDRLDFQFEILKHAFQGRNYFAPIRNPKTILDIGTGTGQWAIELGDEFPSAEVQATDLSPIQPSTVPENVHFFIDDASDEDWVLPAGYFDFIHSRMLLGSFTDFKDIIKRSFFYLKPGGWMESQELMSRPYCDDGTMPSDWLFLEWTKYADEAAMISDRPLRIASKLKRWYEEVGFVDVHERIYKLPMNAWPQDKHLNTLGKMSKDNWLAGLSAFTMAPFSRQLDWTKNEIEVYLANVRKCITDTNVHAYHKVYVVWGRKPGPETPAHGTTQ